MKKSAVLLYRHLVPVVVALLAINLGFGGSLSIWAQTAQAPRPGVQGSHPPYDGETVFRGIFFGSGPVAKLFPEIWENPRLMGFSSDKLSPEGRAMQDRIIERVRAQDSTFFTRFGEDLQSGDHLRIQSTLAAAGHQVLDSVRAEMRSKGHDLPEPDAARVIDVDVEVETYAYLYLVVVVAVAVAVAVALVLVLVLETNEGSPGSTSADTATSSNLQRDVWVNMFANRLGPAGAR